VDRRSNMSKLARYKLPSVHIKGGTSAVIHTDPVSPGGQVWPVGLEIDAEVAPHFVVTDLRVGKNSQLISCECLPASLFTLSPPVDLRCDKIPPGLRFSVHLTCVGLDGVEFRGKLLATSSPDSVPRNTWVVGFGYTEVKAGQTVEVVARPMVDIRLTRLHVPPHLLGVFRVDALFQGRYLDVEQASRVTDVRQLDAGNLSRGGEIDVSPSPVVGVGQPVTARVTNTSETLQYFCAALLGEPAAGSGT
jgi:hypothetical protein